MKAKTKSVRKPVRASETPATSGMLEEMEGRLNHKMDSFRFEMKAQFSGLESTVGGLKSEFSDLKSEVSGLKSEVSGVKSEINGLKSEVNDIKSEVSGLKSEVNGIKSEISGLKSEVNGVKSEVSGIRSEIHRIALLVEEQNARNKYVLDGYAQLYNLINSRLSV